MNACKVWVDNSLYLIFTGETFSKMLLCFALSVLVLGTSPVSSQQHGQKTDGTIGMFQY